MLRRALLSVSLAALGFAGVASATLLSSRAVPGDTSATATGTSGAVTTATVAGTTATTTVATAPLAVGSAPSTVVFTGHGWGHGMGMAQWGALGYAQHGWSYDRILAHYYRGTTIERRPSPTVRVLLIDGEPRATLGSASPWTVTDARGTKVALPVGSLVVDGSLVVAGQTLASPLSFSPGRTPVSVSGKPYRGRVLVFATANRLQVVNVLKLEPYVKGVVGYEMPSNWPAGALQAQAVAARTYALAGLTTVVTARPYDLFADTRSQVYGGIEAESRAVSAAVDATSRQVVLYAGKPITAYFSSSSGGRTVSAAEASGKPVPYLVSVPDPYDSLSPNHNWGPVVFDARKVGKALKLGGDLSDLRTTVGPSGHVTTITAVGASGEVTITGSELRTLLGLRSTWFSVGWLSLASPPKATYGVALQLTGTVRGTGAVTLEARTSGGMWQAVVPVTPDAAGGFQLTVTPQATTQYRLVAGGVAAALVSVPVEPIVDAAASSGAVSGTVRPPSPGVAVQLQRQSGAAWATVATATPDSSGSFSVATAITPGSYRVRFAPGGGLVPGVSRTVAVS